MADKHADEDTAVQRAMEKMRQAGVVLPGQDVPVSEEDAARERQAAEDLRTPLWGDAVKKGLWVINLGRPGRIVIGSLLALSLFASLYGQFYEQALPRMFGGMGLLLVAGFGAALVHRITVDRHAKRATLRFGIMPFIGFSYPLDVCSVQYQSAFGLIGKGHHMLYWSGDFEIRKDPATGLPRPTVSDGLKPRRTQLLSTTNREHAFAVKRKLDALLEPPPLG